ncbi:MAG: amino acid ABC transporter substrate-binding protein [Candidatus Nucleicultricaceae bacterium]
MSKLLTLTSLILFSIISAESPALAGKTMDNITDKKAIVIGYRESSIPYSFLDDSGKAIGYSIDVCNNLIKKLEADKNISLQVDMQPVTAQNWISLVENGSVDIVCASTTITPERAEKANFSAMNADTINPAVLASNETIKQKEDLMGKKVIVIPGTTGERLVNKINNQEKYNMTLVSAKDNPEALLLLEQGRGDVMITDKVLLAGEIAKAEDPKKFKVLDIPLNPFDLLGVMYSKEDKELDTFIKGAMADMKKDGTLFKLHDQWFNQPVGPKKLNLNLKVTEDQKKAIMDAQ